MLSHMTRKMGSRPPDPLTLLGIERRYMSSCDAHHLYPALQAAIHPTMKPPHQSASLEVCGWHV